MNILISYSYVEYYTNMCFDIISAAEIEEYQFS